MNTNSQNVQEILLSGKKVMAGSMVACKLIPQMEVVGFVPMKETDCYLDLGMMDTRVVANRVVVNPQEEKPSHYDGMTFPKAIPYPIYKAITLNQEERQVPLRFLRVISREGGSRYYSEYQMKGVVRPQLFKDEKLVEVTNDGVVMPHYKMDPGEYTFYENGSEVIKAVASCFEVLCRRINMVTGCLVYELYNAEDLIPIVAKES